MRLLVTGGAGFIGSNFVHFWLDQHPSDTVVAYDVLTYAGNLENLADVQDRIAFVKGDIGDGELAAQTLADHQIDTVVNFAAESHNSLAVLDPGLFFRTNVLGTQTLLEASRHHGVARFHHISTCEVYGDLDLDTDERFSEESPYRPRTPYNASKAGADHAVRAYGETFDLPVTITNCCNNYGPFQFPEKVIPLFTTQALDDLPLPLYASTANRREWLHVLDHCRAVEAVLERGEVGETYHVGSGVEASIEEIADAVLGTLEKPFSLKKIVADRPGHDRRYLLDSSKIEHQLGWRPQIPFEAGLAETVRWYQEHRDWWEPLRDRAPVVEGGWDQPRDPARTGPSGTRGEWREVGASRRGSAMRVLVTGASGQVGRDIVSALSGQVPLGGLRCRLVGPEGPLAPVDVEVVEADHHTMPVEERAVVLGTVESLAPDVIIHAAAFTAVDACEGDPDRAFRINAIGTRHVAEAAQRLGAHLVYLSTDYVFDGRSSCPYCEWDAPNPLSVYGRSKLAGELECPSGSTIVRTSWVCGAYGQNMVRTALRLAGGSGTLSIVDDQHGSPTISADLAPAVATLALERRPGVFHVTNQGATTWFGLVRAVLATAGHDPGRGPAYHHSRLGPAPAGCPAGAPVLDNAALRLSGLPGLPDWQDGLERLIPALEPARSAL